MEKRYTNLEGIYVLEDPGDLSPLNLDSCLVARRKGKLYVHALEGLRGKTVEEANGHGSDPVFGYYPKDNTVQLAQK